MSPCPTHRAVSWTFQAIAAAILLQTLWFKFGGAPESIHIFTRLGVEPWGRYATGALELVAAGLLLHPRRAVLGALLAFGLMSGAIGSHLTRLGIEILGDRGLLFALAHVVLAASACVVWLRRTELPFVGPRLAVHCGISHRSSEN